VDTGVSLPWPLYPDPLKGEKGDLVVSLADGESFSNIERGAENRERKALRKAVKKAFSGHKNSKLDSFLVIAVWVEKNRADDDHEATADVLGYPDEQMMQLLTLAMKILPETLKRLMAEDIKKTPGVLRGPEEEEETDG